MLASLFWNIVEGSAIVGAILLSIIGAVWWKRNQTPEGMSSDGLDAKVTNVGPEEAAGAIGQVTENAKDGIEVGAADLAENVEELADNLTDNFTEAASEGSEVLADLGEEAKDLASDASTDLGADLADEVAEAVDAGTVAESVESAVEAAVESTSEVVSELSDEVEEVVETAVEVELPIDESELDQVEEETIEIVGSTEDTVASDAMSNIESDVDELSELTNDTAPSESPADDRVEDELVSATLEATERIAEEVIDSDPEINSEVDPVAPLEFDMPSLEDTAPAAAASLPPRRSEREPEPTPTTTEENVEPSQFHTSTASKGPAPSRDELLSRPIPPRRSRSKPVTPPAAPPQQKPDLQVNSFAASNPSMDDSGEIEVLSKDDYEARLANAAAQEELKELQLALEASHHELTALTESRDQALSIAASHERQVEALKLRLEEAPSDNAIAEVEKQHQTTIDELRKILGEREAAEASLARERDALTEQNAELQRKYDNLSNETSEKPSGPDEESLARIQELEKANQQVTSELSLANESIRQLGQNLSQRDAQVISLRQQHESATTELAALAEAAQQTNDDVISKEEHEQAVQKAVVDATEATKQQAAKQAEEAKAAAAEITQRATDANQQIAAELERSQQSITELNQQFSNLKQQFDGAKEKLDNKQKELDESLARVDSLEKATAEFDEAKQDFAKRLEAKQAELLEAKTQLEDAKQQAVANDTAQQDAESLSILQQQKQQSDSELSLANETIRQLNQNLSQRDAQLMGLRREHDTTAAELSELVAKHEEALANAEEEANQLREQLEKQAADTESSVNNAKAISLLIAERDETVEQIGVANRQLSESQRLLENVQSELGLERQKVTDLEAQVDELRKEVDSNQAAIEEPDNSELIAAQVLIARLEDEKKELQSKVEEAIRAQPETAPAEPKADSAESEDSSPATASRLAELEQEIEQHEKYAEGLQAEKQDLLDRLGAYQEEINMKSDEMKKMKERLKVAESEADTANQQQEAFRQSQETTEKLTNELKGKLTDLRRIQDEQIELKQELAAFIEASEKWDAERISLYSQLGLDENGDPIDDESASAGTATPPTTANVPETRVVQVPSEESLAEIARLKTALTDRDGAFSELQNRFEELQKMYDESDSANVLDGDISDEMDTLRADRDQAAAAAAASSATIAKLMTDINRLTADAEKKTPPPPKAEKAVEPEPASKDEIDRMSAEIEKLTSENREYRRSVAELHAIANELEESRLERQREQESARQRLQEATAGNAELNAVIAELNQQLEDAKLERTQLDEAKVKIAELETAYTQLDTESVEESAESESLQEQLDAANEAKLTAEAQAQAERRSRNQAEQKLKSLGEEKAKLEAELSEIEAATSSKASIRKTNAELNRLAKALVSSEKKRLANDDRLQDLAIELGRARADVKSLSSQLTEQRAVVRALNDGVEISPSNGQPKASKKTVAKKTVAKKSTPKKKRTTKNGTSKKTPSKTAKSTKSASTKSDSNLGRVFTKRPTEVDDLKQILGVGPVLEKRLNSAGIYQFEQVRDWSDETIEYLDEKLSLAGRIERDEWLKQASELAKKK